MINNLILDVDETLIHSFTNKQDAMAHGGYDMITSDRQYFVQFRPGLHDFLEYALANYNVAIYSVATEDYVEDILSYLIDMSQLSVVWTREHCTKHEIPMYGLFQSSHQYTYKKPLSKLVKATGWNIEECVMIDDSVATTGTVNNYRILIHPFEGGRDDTHLSMIQSFLDFHKDGNYETSLIDFEHYHQPASWIDLS